MPHLPHSSTGSTTIHCCTILPWFVGVGPDLEMLEIFDSDTWEDLSCAHCDLIAGPHRAPPCRRLDGINYDLCPQLMPRLLAVAS